MQIEIKNLLLEGYNPEVIVEAVHTNHPHLNKRNPETKQKRDNLAKIIKITRRSRSLGSRLPEMDNNARAMSQTGRIAGYPIDHTKEFQAAKTQNLKKILNKEFEETPRIIDSAKQ